MVSEPYSRVPGKKNWRHRVVDLHVFISGPQRFLPFLNENLGRRHDDLHGLTVRGFCAMQDLYCCLLLCTYLLSSSLDLLQDMVTLTLTVTVLRPTPQLRLVCIDRVIIARLHGVHVTYS